MAQNYHKVGDNKAGIVLFDGECNLCNGSVQFIIKRDPNGYFRFASLLSYSDFKNQLLEAQKRLVENLSVPIIPITSSVCVLPLIGSIDNYRTNVLEEKVLLEISRLHIQTLIIDLSGISEMEVDVIDHLVKIIDGTAMMGCKAVITGLRPEIVRKMIHLGLTIKNKAEMKGTLQLALKDYLT